MKNVLLILGLTVIFFGCTKEDMKLTGNLEIQLYNISNDLELYIYFDGQQDDFFQKIGPIDRSKKIILEMNIGNYTLLPVSSSETYEKKTFQIVQGNTTHIIYDKYNIGKLLYK